MSGRKHLPNSRISSPAGALASSASPPSSVGGSSPAFDPLDLVTFPSCDHLKRLLGSQARDLVMKNYHLSIKVSCLAYPQPGLRFTTGPGKAAKSSTAAVNGNGPPNKIAKKTVPAASVDRKKLLKLRTSAVKCSHCKNNLSVNLICLQCPHVGCFDKKHGAEHSAATHHLFAISTFGQVYCFRCNDYVSHPELERIRINSLQTTNRLSSAPGMPIYPFIENLSTESRKFIEDNSRLPSFKASTGLRGFVNMGATCYMSTIIQTLIHNPFVREHFLSGSHMKCVKKLENDDTCITCRIDEVFVDFFTSNSITGFGLTKFLTTCWKINKSLAGYSQQDAHEFWQFVLGEFHKSHLINHQHAKIHNAKLNNSDDTNVKVTKHMRSSSISFGSNEHCDCLTHKIFSGELQSSIKCHECNNVNKTVDPMIDLLLEIKNKTTKSAVGNLHDCLSWFTKPESLESNYSCTSCNRKTNASKKLSIKKLGPVLSIQLKRFEHLATGASVKLEEKVEYPIILDVSKYVTSTVSATAQKGELVYELFAIVCHIGQVNNGHYVCIIKNGEGKWFKFDDSMVTIISQQEALATNAYLLFYIKHQFP